MTDATERDRIRKQKRERIKQELENGGEVAETIETSGPDAPAEPIHVDGGEHLEELVDTYDVVLADFYADWCGPCKMIEPIVAELATETSAAVAKVDIDANQALAGQLGIRGVPTLFLYADGEQVEQLVGMQEKGRLQELIERYA